MRIRFVQSIIDTIRNKISCLEQFADKYSGLEMNKGFHTLIIGSSHVASAYRPIKGEYNLAIPSQDLYYSWHLYEKYNNPDIKKVIFSFSVFSPGHNLMKCPYAKFCILYREVFGIPYISQELAEKKELYKEEKRYKKALAKYFAKQKLSSDFYGARNIFKPSKYNKERRQFYAQKHWKYAQYKPSQMEYFFRLLSATRDNNQELVIVIPPATDDYKEALPTSDILFKELYDAVKDYNHIKLFNYYDVKDFDDSDFLDGDHLNLKGGEKLTAMIRKDMG